MPVWTEDQTLGLTNGFYATHLGSQSALDPALLDGNPLWLGVSVDAEDLLPRQKVASVTYALHADTSTNLAG